MNVFLRIVDKISTYILVCFIGSFFFSCGNNAEVPNRVGVLSSIVEVDMEVIPAAENVGDYYNLLKGKKVGMVVNQTSTIGKVHLVDSLLKLNVDIQSIFAPEHGFRGKADAGEKIKDGFDVKSGLPVKSLYGKKKKPSAEDVKGIEVMVFDIQDVGARFYTYISTLHYIMESCAENGIQLIVLDRPNPNAHYVDGPILEKKYTSFVGMHPVPVVYGMTIGEYALMINGEGWLKDGIQADLKVVKNGNYTHNTFYELPTKPSPNLPNIQSILLYPSLCFFEGTTVSVGRGTQNQFQVVGHPNYSIGSYLFTPVSMDGAKYPKHEGIPCYGQNLTSQTKSGLFDKKKLDLSFLLSFYKHLNSQGNPFFLENKFFEKLAGTGKLRQQIIDGVSEEEIRNSWKKGLEDFHTTRSKYLLYD
ncbi:MAG: DUF1343 domain-containing protein [Saprospiraceae bacterium]|nr:DUF1343 domain-containing protein [Saprospiraceae bacterium]